MLVPGHHSINKPVPANGEATLNGVVLTRGDRVGLTLEFSLPVTARRTAAHLCIDKGPAPSSFANGVMQ